MRLARTQSKAENGNVKLQKRNQLARLEHLDWDQVRTFLACARAGQLGAAATRLAMDTSTASRRLARLEAELGLTLFERSRQGLTATAAAEQLLPAAEAMEAAMHRLASAAGTIESEAEGVVRIAAPPGIADAFVAPMLVELHARYPKIRIELDARVAVVDLTRGEADLALRTIRPTGGDLVMTQVAQVRSIPMASAAYARELGALRDLGHARWIFWSAELAHLPEQRWLDHHVEAMPVLRTSHFQSQIAAVKTGLGLALLPEPYAAIHDLVAVEHTRGLAAAWRALPTSELWIVGHQALRHVPRVAVVWEALLARFGHPARFAPPTTAATITALR